MVAVFTAVMSAAASATTDQPIVKVSLPIGAWIMIGAGALLLIGMLIGIAYWQTHPKKG